MRSPAITRLARPQIAPHCARRREASPGRRVSESFRSSWCDLKYSGKQAIQLLTEVLNSDASASESKLRHVYRSWRSGCEQKLRRIIQVSSVDATLRFACESIAVGDVPPAITSESRDADPRNVRRPLHRVPTRDPTIRRTTMEQIESRRIQQSAREREKQSA